MGIHGLHRASPATFAPNYGDGSDGSPASSSFTVAKQTYQWVNYTLSNGHTILLSSYRPSILRVQGTLTINGTINGGACGNLGGATLAPAEDGRPNYSGSGCGGGWPGQAGAYGSGGGGASHGTAGEQGGQGSSAYVGGFAGATYSALFDYLMGGAGSGAYMVGSGGGAGGSSNYGGSGEGGAGGAGGGGLLVIARRIVVGSTAVINCGGAQGAAAANNGGSGGSGSGGLIALIGEVIELPTSGTELSAPGGAQRAATSGGGYGGAGGAGRVYLCPLSAVTPSDAASRCSPAATIVSLKATMSLG